MIKTFFEENKTIEFIETVDNNSLIRILDYSKKSVMAETLITSFYDFDLQSLINFYKQYGLDELLNTSVL